MTERHVSSRSVESFLKRRLDDELLDCLPDQHSQQGVKRFAVYMCNYSDVISALLHIL